MYIGKQPQVGNYVKLDTITTSSTNTYNLTQDSVAFVPESALHMLVSLNGVIQSPLSSFSVSGSTITFLPSSGTLSSSDTIDFILVLGNTLDIGTPSDSTVTNAKTNFVSTSSSAGLQIKGDGTTDGTLQLNCSQNSHGIKLASPAHSAGQSYTLTFPTTAPVADKALITDGSGNLSFGDSGALKLLYSASSSVDASSVDVSDTYINSTYDSYYVIGNFRPATDDNYLYIKLKSSGSIITGSKHTYDLLGPGNDLADSADFITTQYSSCGNAIGEGNLIDFFMHNVNNTLYPVRIQGASRLGFEGAGQPECSNIHGGLITSEYATVVNGISFVFSSGNIDTYSIKVYGIS
tara:strand:+ start:119 stop:1168 length:1050 start_codon:yes stop_codon:yes gene_type:complete